jgi:Leucine-rich repeat (LRR) protein
MRHVKGYQELFEAQIGLTPEQTEWLDKCTRGSWTLNPQTGLVDVNGDFYCSGQRLTDFKGVRFGVVSGSFHCHNNELTSLDGAPQRVGWIFNCSRNQLISLEGAPQDVVEYFECYSNKLTSLEGAPSRVGVNFNCRNNQLISLEGAPEKVGWQFDCSYNNLTSLKNAPKEVRGNLDCSFNKLTSLEGAPPRVKGGFNFSNNPVSESVLKALYKKMQSGMNWPDAVASQWRYIRSEEDKDLLAPSNSNFSPEELKGYQALAKLKKRIL